MTSQSIWTQDELSSNLTELHEQEVWRMVEAQHEIATLAITENLKDQEELERILEDFKPPKPQGLANLHYLLATPFRYRSVKGVQKPDNGSRFRPSGAPEGVFYCSVDPEACAYEMAFYRSRFFAESPGLDYPTGGISLSAFSTTISSTKVLDLTTHPTLKQFSADWEDADSYDACQRLANDARMAGVEVIGYKSVRDIKGRKNYAILDPAAFLSGQIKAQQTWSCILTPNTTYMRRQFPPKTLEI